MNSVVPSFEVPPYRLSGVVYGALLNHRSAVAALGDCLNQAPYKAAPKAPILYVKPRNTLAAAGDVVLVPGDSAQLQIGASLGVVLGRTACRLDESNALDHVAGYLIVNDVSVPHDSFYRPSIRLKARDGFCPIGPRVVARAAIADPNALSIRIFVDGKLRQAVNTSGFVRSVARMLVDVTDFMTLAPGDILAMGVAAPAPCVSAGCEVRIEIDGLGSLSNRFAGSAG